MTDNMPAAEVDIDADLVRRLLGAQHPDLADLAIVEISEGWDNVLYRLGDDLSVRLPRRQMAAPLIENEQRWLPVLAPVLPLTIPVPLRVGRPGEGYPWTWTVARWLPGTIAALAPPDDPFETGETLGHFLAALHVSAPADAPSNPYRGVPLADRAVISDERLHRLERLGLVDGPQARNLWAAALATPRWSGPPRWVHGDLHPANLLVDGGRLSGVIDFGDITAGDPATDLAVAWMLLPAAARQTFRDAAGEVHEVDDDTWSRAKGWALLHGLACVANGADNPVIAAMGARTLVAVLADS